MFEKKTGRTLPNGKPERANDWKRLRDAHDDGTAQRIHHAMRKAPGRRSNKTLNDSIDRALADETVSRRGISGCAVLIGIGSLLLAGALVVGHYADEIKTKIAGLNKNGEPHNIKKP